MEVCEIARLPEELVSAALARTSPRDACRAAAVSRPFRAAKRWIARLLPSCHLLLRPKLIHNQAEPLLHPPPSASSLSLRSPNHRIKENPWGLRSPIHPSSHSQTKLTISHSPPPPPNRITRDQADSTPAEEPMEVCEIARLPEELVSAAVARTTPRDACRAAAVSRPFRAAADSDAVWARFLPPGALPPLADEELAAPAPPASKKELFLRLSAGPALLQDRLVSMWLDRETGTKCYMLSARNLFIVWGDTPDYWSWIPLEDSRFSEGAQLMYVFWFEIRGKIHSSMLSEDTTYAAYMVFKMTDDFHGLGFPVQEASVSVGATNLTRKVCLQGNEDDEEDDEVPENYRPMGLFLQPRLRRRNGRVISHEEDVTFPQQRDDGWMELELGEFFSEGGDDGEVSLSLMETRGGNLKSGIIVQGIEIRRKKSG